jgi:hypothetical protein
MVIEKENFKVLISQAFYEVKAYAPQIACLIDAFKVLDELKIQYGYKMICGDSYVDRAKNSLVHDFLKSDCSHLMIIDSDETWDIEGFARLIRAALQGYEVTCALYPCKNNWEFFGGAPKQVDGMIVGKEDGDVRVIEMEVAPGGFIIYSREAFERTRPTLDMYVDPETGEEILEAFRCNIEKPEIKRKSIEELAAMTKEGLIKYIFDIRQGGRVGIRIGEDVYFQKRYQEMGGKVFCEPNVNMGHFGIKEWKGNFHEHLLKSREKTCESPLSIAPLE